MTEQTQTSESTRSSDEQVVAAELERHGIVSIPATVYEWGGYRYSNARDAIAAAKRGAAA